MWTAVLVLLGVLAYSTAGSYDKYAGLFVVAVLAGVFLLEIAGGVPAVTVVLIRGVLSEEGRHATSAALPLGGTSAALVTNVLYLIGPESWYQPNEADVVLAGVAMAAVIFAAGRCLVRNGGQLDPGQGGIPRETCIRRAQSFQSVQTHANGFVQSR